MSAETALEETRRSYRRFHARRHRMLADLLAKHAPCSVNRCLDIGGGGDIAGAGPLLRDRFAAELHAVDLAGDVDRGRSKGMIARECNVDHQPLPYAEGFFDVVILASVIEHLYNPRHVVDEVARVLARGGLFVVEAPNAVALGRRLGALAGGNPFCKFNQYNALEDKALMTNCAVFYTVGEIEALLDRHFNVIDRCHCMHSPPANPVKRLLRELAFRLNPRLGDCFFVIATRE